VAARPPVLARPPRAERRRAGGAEARRGGLRRPEVDEASGCCCCCGGGGGHGSRAGWESGWGAAFVARVRAHAWVAAVIETVRVVLDERHAAGAGGRAIVITSSRTRMKFVI